jgi:hypothetical protein
VKSFLHKMNLESVLEQVTMPTATPAKTDGITGQQSSHHD